MSLIKKLFSGRPRVAPVHLESQADFTREVLQSELPVILDVWSTTCAPCRKLVPVLVNVATKYAGRVKVAELRADADPRLLATLDVRATPTILVFDGGQEIGRMAGFRPEGWFDQMIATELLDDTAS